MTADVVLIIAGCVLIAIGILGGGIQSAHVTIRNLGFTPRILTAVIGFFFVIGGVYLKLLPPAQLKQSEISKVAEDKPLDTNKGLVSTPSGHELYMPAAKQWLERIDNSRFEEAYNSAATAWKSAGKREFINVFTTVRMPMGRVVSRQALGVTTVDKVKLNLASAGIPVLVNQVKFDRSGNHFEYLLFLAEDGMWKVAGHFISPTPLHVL